MKTFCLLLLGLPMAKLLLNVPLSKKMPIALSGALGSLLDSLSNHKGEEGAGL